MKGDVFIRKSFGPVDQSSVNIEIVEDSEKKRSIT